MEISYLPSVEFWLGWPPALAAMAAIIAAGLGFIPSRLWHWRTIAIMVVGILTAWGIALSNERSAKPERDYVYLFVHPSRQALLPNGNVELFRRSTGVLDKVKICFAPTAEYLNAKSYPCFLNREGGMFHTFDESAEPFADIPPGDWTFDIDPLSRMGKVLERLNIVRNGDKIRVEDMEVTRKETREILCQYPVKLDIPKCF